MRNIAILTFFCVAILSTGCGTRNESFYAPGGISFAVELMTGLEAPSGIYAKDQAHPVLLRVQDLSWFPSGLSHNVTGCFVLGEGYGDLATGRVFVRGITLSCVNKGNTSVLDEAISGFVVDTDEMVGLRGHVVSNLGRSVGRTLQKSLVEGATETSADFAENRLAFLEQMRASSGSAIKRANKMSEFYLKSADNLFPIIEINAQRHGTFIILDGKQFSFNKY